MEIAKIINEYGNRFSPYASGLVNHLPMAQMALYKMGNTMDMIKLYSKNYENRGRLDKVKDEYEQVESIEQSLGKIDLYQGCLELIKKEMETIGPDKLILKILNTYPLGLSSGLFHTTIRLAYAIEGMKTDEDLTEEVARALAYYVTAYKEGKIFTRKVEPAQFKEETEKLFVDPNTIQLLNSEASLGRKLNAFYNDKIFLEKAPLIEGSSEEKVDALLKLALPILDSTNSIVALHCVTGLHAVLVLEEYFNDFPYILDIMTTYIITHLLALDAEQAEIELSNMSWDQIIKAGSNSSNVHTIKFGYSASELYKRDNMEELEESAAIRITRDK